MSNFGDLKIVKPVVTPGLLAEWTTWMRAAGMSGRTIEARVQLVELLARRENIDPATTGWQSVAAFLADPGFAASTRQTYQTHLRAWFQWLVLMDHRLDDPTMKLHKPRAPRRRPRPITVQQLGRILGSRMHRRTRWMILLAAYEGLRVHEIAKVRGEHVRGNDLRVIGKGGVDVDIPVHRLIAEVALEAPQIGFWFPSHTLLGPVKSRSVSTIIAQAMERAGVPGTAHQLRHFFGTYVLRSSGGNLRVAQELLRHANIATTAGYTEVDDAERRAAVDALPVPLYSVR